MANIDKIVKSKYPPKQTNVAWVDLSGETPIEKHFINGRWVAVSGGGGGSSSNGVQKIIAGNNVSVSPESGTGNVTIGVDSSNFPKRIHVVNIDDLTDEQVAGLCVGDIIEQGLEEENWKLVYYVYNIDDDGVVYLVSFQGNLQESTGTVLFWKLDKPNTDYWELIHVDYISKTLARNELPVGNAILPNVLYKLGTLNNDESLTITLATPTYDSVANIYHITFDTGDFGNTTGPTIVWDLPLTTRWVGGDEPEIKPNTYYEVRILDNIAFAIISSLDGSESNIDYNDLENKPSINGVELNGNKTSSELGVYSKPQTGIPESDLSSDVQQALQKHFKGWWPDLATLKAAHTATEGDSAYVKDASPATTWSIYVYDSTASLDNYWADSGTDADTSNVQTFASGEEVNEVHIVNDLTTGGTDDVASAETVKTIAENTMELVEGFNILDPTTIDTTHRLNTSGALLSKGTYTQVYGVTDYIEIGDGVICNHSVPASGLSVVGVAVYDINKLFIGHRSSEDLGGSRPITKSTNLSGTPAEGSDPTNPTYVRFSLYNPEYVDGGVAYDGVTDGYAVYKGTNLPQSFIPYAAPHWEQKKQVIEDGEITTAKIADSAVTIDKMADTVEEFMSKNLCNPEECVIGNGKAISINNGNLVNSNVFDGQTGFIPIDERGLYCNKTNDVGASSGNMLYNANKQPLQAALGQSYLRGKYLKYVEGAVYAKFSLLPVESASEIIVNRGNIAVDYEPYAGTKKVISPDILPDMIGSSEVKTYLEGVEVQLPTEIVVTKGDNLQMFYRSCVKCRNIEAFDVTANCKKGSTYYGMPHPRYFQLDTSSSSIAANNSFTLTITVSDNAHRVVASGSTTIRVINTMSSPSATKNILMLGASTLADGRITRELYRRLCTNTGSGTPLEPTGINLSNIAFVGSGSAGGTTYPNVYQEANSGKGWNWYADQGSNTNIYRFFCPSTVDLSNASEGDIYKQGTLTFELTNDISTQDNVFTAIVTGTGTVVASNGTLTKSSGSGPDTISYNTASAEGGNPFWYGGKLDFQHYANDANNHCNGSIDLIIACLGGNDIAQVAEGFEYCKETYIKPFLDAFHTDFPNGKILIYTPPLMRYNGCATKPSANYWSRVVQFWAYAKGYGDLLTEEYAEGHTYSEFVSVTATTYEFDNVNLFGGSDIPVCNRSVVTEKFSTDNLHYGLAGCNTVADTLYHCINDVL